jgi:hypothetical protein
MILEIIENHYLLYFRMIDVEAEKKELLRFDNYLKEECHDLYSDCNGLNPQLCWGEWNKQ